MKLKSLFIALLTFGTAFAAETAPLQLKGVLNTGREKIFGLSTETGDSSAWVGLGKSFAGYTLKSYDDAKSLLMLERDGKTFELGLVSAKVTTAEAAKGTRATVTDAAAVIDRMHFEEMMTKMLDQQKKAMTTGMAQQMAKQMGDKVDPKEFGEFQGKVMDVMYEAMNIPQMKKEITQIYAETFTKEELTAMSDFYATPAGQSLNDKQPEVQQKMQELLMPRIMAAMPKVQQLGIEFAQQQQAKEAAATAADGAKTSAAPAPATTTK
jgi:hypothetical protein